MTGLTYTLCISCPTNAQVMPQIAHLSAKITPLYNDGQSMAELCGDIVCKNIHLLWEHCSLLSSFCLLILFYVFLLLAMANVLLVLSLQCNLSLLLLLFIITKIQRYRNIHPGLLQLLYKVWSNTGSWILHPWHRYSKYPINRMKGSFVQVVTDMSHFYGHVISQSEWKWARKQAPIGVGWFSC